MGFFADAYDLFIIGVAATLITSEWHIASYQKSLLSSLALLTSVIGAIVFGHVADKLGRRKIYGYEVLVLAVGAIATAFAPNIWWLIGLRGVLGFGIGGDYPVSATIMSEYASKRNRGKMVALVFSMQGAGLVIGPLVAIGLLHTGMSQDYAWRVMLALGAIPALAVFGLRRRIKETPRFLLAEMESREVEQQACPSPDHDARHRGRRREDRGVHRHLCPDRAAAVHRPQPDQRDRRRRGGPRPACHGYHAARAQGLQPGRLHREAPAEQRGRARGLREPRHPSASRGGLAGPDRRGSRRHPARDREFERPAPRLSSRT